MDIFKGRTPVLYSPLFSIQPMEIQAFMRKSALIAAIFISTFCFPVAVVRADEDVVPVAKSAAGQQNLVDLDSKNIAGKLRDIEREVEEIQRERRSQDERIRNLERTVNDLRRGR